MDPRFVANPDPDENLALIYSKSSISKLNHFKKLKYRYLVFTTNLLFHIFQLKKKLFNEVKMMFFD